MNEWVFVVLLCAFRIARNIFSLELKSFVEGNTRTGLYKWKLGIILHRMETMKIRGAAGGLTSLIRGD
jgi:hypothetical protein